MKHVIETKIIFNDGHWHLLWQLTPSCVESEAIPYELFVITVIIDIADELWNWTFSFEVTGWQNDGISNLQHDYYF